MDVPAGIDRTGTTDAAAAILEWLAGVPDGTNVAFPTDGRYRCETTLRLVDRHGLTFRLNGAEMFATQAAPPAGAARNRSQWRLEGGSDLTFLDAKVRGANPHGGTNPDAYNAAYEAQHGFDVLGVDGLLIERADISDVYGDFAYFGARSKHCRITGSTMMRNGRQGIAITDADDIVIDRNRIDQVRRSMFDIEPNTSTAACRRITIEGNTCGLARLNFLANDGFSATVEDVVVQDNTSAGPLTIVCRGNPAARRKRYRILRNTSPSSFGSPGALMVFEHVDGIEIAGNVQRFDPGRDEGGGVYLEDCTGAVVWPDNRFDGAFVRVKVA